GARTNQDARETPEGWCASPASKARRRQDSSCGSGSIASLTRVRSFKGPRPLICGHAQGPIGHTVGGGGEFIMRMEGAPSPSTGSLESAPGCGGFWIVWLDGRASVRLVPGDRTLLPGLSQAVVDALAEAPDVLRDALRLRAPQQPWDRVEVSIGPGGRTEGEAVSLGSGCIRLAIGQEASPEDAAGIA